MNPRWHSLLPSRPACIVIALAVLHAPALARPLGAQQAETAPLAPGARVRLTELEGDRWVGRLLVLEDTMLVIDPDGLLFRRFRVDPRELEKLERAENPGARTRAPMAGLLLGAAAGAAVGALSVHDECTESGGIGPCFDRGDGALLGALAGASVGVTLGRLVFGRDRWIPVPLPLAPLVRSPAGAPREPSAASPPPSRPEWR